MNQSIVNIWVMLAPVVKIGSVEQELDDFYVAKFFLHPLPQNVSCFPIAPDPDERIVIAVNATHGVRLDPFLATQTCQFFGGGIRRLLETKEEIVKIFPIK